MFANLHGFRGRIASWIEHPRQQFIVIAVILANAVTLGLETIPSARDFGGGVLHTADQVILAVFVVELALKLIGHGRRFFSSAWNVFDFIIVAVALVPAASALSILRTLRVFRLLRLLNKVPRLRMIVESMLMAIPSIGWVTLMLLLVFYIFAVIGTNLFGAAFPDWFGSLGATLYTLFQIMTLESWSMGIARPVIAEFPHAPLFFVPFILIATYSMLNLFIAIIVSTMQSLSAAEAKENAASAPAPAEPAALLGEMQRLHERIAGLEALLLSANARSLAPAAGEHAFAASAHAPLGTPAEAAAPPGTSLPS
jgi:voltage-gated sodium channel